MGWRDKRERELEKELRSHFDLETEEQQDAGLQVKEARYASQRAFGNEMLVKERVREMWGWTWFDRLRQDLRYGLRTLGRSPGFTLVVVLSLALGIGANTAIFSVVDGLILRMLPVRDPQQLVQIRGTVYSEFLRTSIPFDGFPVSVYEQFREHSDVFAGVISLDGLDHPEVSIGGQLEPLELQLVSGNFFSELGVQPVLGRLIAPEEDRKTDANPVAVISYGLWQRRFALDRSVLGKKITVNNVSLEIIGITPPRFFGVYTDRPSDLWMPSGMRIQVSPASSPNGLVTMMARLKPGISQERAGAVLTAHYAGLPAAMRFTKGSSKPGTIQAVPGGRGYSVLRESFGQSLRILTIVVGLVLLTACANVASLLLARATSRRTEIGTRLAIGAGRWRLVQQLLTESLLLAACGGIAGLGLAWWGNHALLALLPERSRPGTLLEGQSPLAMHLDLRILGFTAAVSLITGILFGLLPALRATRVNLAHGSRSSASDSRHSLRLNKLLVVSQVAMSLVLLAAAGLFVRSLEKLRSVDLGFNPERLIQVSISTREAGYRGPQVGALYKLLLDRLAAIPGVQSVSGVRNGLIQNGGTSTTFSIPGSASSPDQNTPIDSADVGLRFFETAGQPLIAGRDFTAADHAQSPRVVVINEALARRYFPAQNPLGRRIDTGGGVTPEIVGIAKDARTMTLRRDIQPMVYFPALQRNLDRVNAIEIRTTGDPSGVMAAARQEVLAIDKRLLLSVRTMPQQIDDTLAQERMIGKLSGFFGLLALLLASGGLYGLMAYSVARRTGEIGIRMALGAQRGNVLWMVLRETLALVSTGLAIGVPFAWGTARLAGHWIEGLLYGMKATDPATIALAALMLALVAAFAGAIPARRASHVDPMVALRYE